MAIVCHLFYNHWTFYRATMAIFSLKYYSLVAKIFEWEITCSIKIVKAGFYYFLVSIVCQAKPLIIPWMGITKCELQTWSVQLTVKWCPTQSAHSTAPTCTGTTHVLVIKLREENQCVAIEIKVHNKMQTHRIYTHGHTNTHINTHPRSVFARIKQ